MLLHDKIKIYNVVLASRSPRRHTLLRELGIDFEVKINGVEDETYPSDIPINDVPEFLAKKKAIPFINELKTNDILITSDTIVVCCNEVIGKPVDRDNALDILKTLSGKKHTVITGVCFTSKALVHSFSVHTDVYFRNLTYDELNYYVDRFKPFDKAGAYGIQEWIGYVGVERIEGSYFNVMGLPVQRLYVELNNFLDEIKG